MNKLLPETVVNAGIDDRHDGETAAPRNTGAALTDVRRDALVTLVGIAGADSRRRRRKARR